MNQFYDYLFNCDRNNYQHHQQWMKFALILAQQAGRAGDVPVGAILVNAQGDCIATGENRKHRDQDPTAHAEILALQSASQRQQTWSLHHCTLYVTLEPCPMCAGAMIHSRLGLLVYGADDPKTGSIRTVINLPDSGASNHRLKVLGGVLGSRCSQQLKRWFQHRRKN